MTIFTIGHSDLNEQRFVELLQENGVEALLDVRSAPYSRYSPQFNRESIVHTLDNVGIAYVYAGEYLGGRPKDPSCYRNGIVPGQGADYLKLVDYPAVATKEWYARAIDRLLEIAAEQRVAIMCSEEDPQQCHRHHLIAQTLLDRDCQVMHIRKNGQTEAAKPRVEEMPKLIQPSLPI